MSLKTFIKINNGLCFSVKGGVPVLRCRVCPNLVICATNIREHQPRCLGLSLYSLDLYFVLMAVTAEKADSHK